MKKIAITLVLFLGLVYARDVAPVNNKLVQKECSSCHMVYQPGLLPSRSWTKIMENLSNHFGVDASLDKKDNQDILKYLKNNAGKYYVAKYGKNKKVPIRFTSTRYFKRAHHEVRRSTFKKKSIQSASNCIACHTTANRGIYNEDYVRIPR